MPKSFRSYLWVLAAVDVCSVGELVLRFQGSGTREKLRPWKRALRSFRTVLLWVRGSMPLAGCSACLIEEYTEASHVCEGVDMPVLKKRHVLPGFWSSSSNGGRYGSCFMGHTVSHFHSFTWKWSRNISVFLVQIKLGKSYFHSHFGYPMCLKKEKESARSDWVSQAKLRVTDVFAWLH